MPPRGIRKVRGAPKVAAAPKAAAATKAPARSKATKSEVDSVDDDSDEPGKIAKKPKKAAVTPIKPAIEKPKTLSSAAKIDNYRAHTSDDDDRELSIEGFMSGGKTAGGRSKNSRVEKSGDVSREEKKEARSRKTKGSKKVKDQAQHVLPKSFSARWVFQRDDDVRAFMEKTGGRMGIKDEQVLLKDPRMIEDAEDSLDVVKLQFGLLKFKDGDRAGLTIKDMWVSSGDGLPIQVCQSNVT